MELTTLSWWLIISNAVNNLCILPFVLGLLGMLAALFLFIPVYEGSREAAAWQKTFVWWSVVLFVLASPAAVVPSTEQIMAIAAVELGDDIVKSEEFKQLLDVYLGENK